MKWSYSFKKYKGNQKDGKCHEEGNGNGEYEGDLMDGKRHGQGKAIYADGGVYEGNWKHGKMHGEGNYTYADGTVYEGNWEGCNKHGWGQMTYADGGKYEGNWINNKWHGKGRMTHADGAVYEGNWLNDKYHGEGKVTYADGGVYKGIWKDGKWHGKGRMTHADGAVYEGNWVDGNKHGWGEMTYADGAVYKGNWSHDKWHGKGEMTFAVADGRKYEGEFTDGKMHGEGKMTYADKGVYEGDWTEAKRHGWGEMTYADKVVFDGEWVNDKKHGFGKATYSDGRAYEGIWTDDMRHGKGKMNYADGRMYKGNWENDKRHGKGKMTYAGGEEEYRGDWNNSMRHGEGKMTYSDGGKYDGEWADGKRHGSGEMKYADGGVYVGGWVDDKPNRKKVCIVGGGPVGLMTACLLIDYARRNLDPVPMIFICERRWKYDDFGKVVWKGEAEGNNRRQQVVTLQSNVWSALPKFVQSVLFKEEGKDYCEMWPLGPDSPEEKGFPRNIPIRYIEDKLLELLQDADTLTKLGVPSMPELRIFSGKDDEERKAELKGVLKDTDFLVLSDGGRSQTEVLLKQMQVIGKDDFQRIPFKNDPQKELKDVVLGIRVDLRGLDHGTRLNELESMLVTISQNRFLLNPLPNHFGFLNMWLTKEEQELAVGVKKGGENDGLEVRCTQATPCRFVFDAGAEGGGGYVCPTHGTIFKPTLDEDSNELWKNIRSGLQLYGIPLGNVKEFVKFNLGPYSERREFLCQVNNDKMRVFILGDAAISVNFRYGRGLNTGLKGAISLARTISSNPNREAEFLGHEQTMFGLQKREVHIRSLLSMKVTDIEPNRSDSDLKSDENSSIQTKFADRVLSFVRAIEGRNKSRLPDRNLEASEDKIRSKINSLDPSFVRDLYDTKPWETHGVGGVEVTVIPEEPRYCMTDPERGKGYYTGEVDELGLANDDNGRIDLENGSYFVGQFSKGNMIN